MRFFRNIGILLLLIYTLAACKDQPMPFDKNKWDNSEDEVHYISDDNRYKMTLWLEQNYTFCGKEAQEIFDKFYKQRDEWFWKSIAENKKIAIITKQKDPNFIMGIDPWIDTDWIELAFDENNRVSQASIVHFNPNTEEHARRIICK